MRQDARPRAAPLEAVIVAGGFGTRLLPLTARRPKHLLEVGGVPFLEHQIARLAEAGVEPRRPGDVVPRRPLRAGPRRRQPVGDPAGLRAGAGAARHRGRDPQRRRRRSATTPSGAVVILNGDVLSGHDLRAQLADFDDPARRAAGRRLAAPRRGRRRPGVRLRADRRGRPGHRLRREVRQPGHRPGQRRLLRLPASGRRRDPAGRVVSVERETFPGLVADGRPRRRVRRDGVLARRGHPAGAGGRLARPGPRRRAEPGGRRRPGPASGGARGRRRRARVADGGSAVLRTAVGRRRRGRAGAAC